MDAEVMLPNYKMTLPCTVIVMVIYKLLPIIICMLSCNIFSIDVNVFVLHLLISVYLPYLVTLETFLILSVTSDQLHEYINVGLSWHTFTLIMEHSVLQQEVYVTEDYIHVCGKLNSHSLCFKTMFISSTSMFTICIVAQLQLQYTVPHLSPLSPLHTQVYIMHICLLILIFF